MRCNTKHFEWELEADLVVTRELDFVENCQAGFAGDIVAVYLGFLVSTIRGC